MITELQLLLLRLFVVFLLCPRISNLFLFNLRGTPRIDLLLSKFSLVFSVLASSFLELTLSAGETNTIVLDKAILGEEKSYPKPVLSET